MTNDTKDIPVATIKVAKPVDPSAIKSGMGDSFSESPLSMAAQIAQREPTKAEVEEANKPTRLPGFYSIHSGMCCGEKWPMDAPFLPNTKPQLEFCLSLLDRGYAELELMEGMTEKELRQTLADMK